MAYHELTKESGGTADDRRSEASRLMKIIEGFEWDDMTSAEITFLNEMEENDTRPVSTKQLFWLRDIKDKYL